MELDMMTHDFIWFVPIQALAALPATWQSCEPGEPVAGSKIRSLVQMLHAVVTVRKIYNTTETLYPRTNGRPTSETEIGYSKSFEWNKSLGVIWIIMIKSSDSHQKFASGRASNAPWTTAVQCWLCLWLVVPVFACPRVLLASCSCRGRGGSLSFSNVLFFRRLVGLLQYLPSLVVCGQVCWLAQALQSL